MTLARQRSEEDSRLKVVYIDDQQMLAMFSDYAHRILPELPDLPEDAVVKAVYHDPMRSCFVLQVHSFSFEPLLPGMMIPPFYSGALELVEAKIVSREDMQKSPVSPLPYADLHF